MPISSGIMYWCTRTQPHRRGLRASGRGYEGDKVSPELRFNGVLRSSLNQKRSSGSHMAGPIVAVKFGGRLQVVIASYGRLGCRGTAKALVMPASMGDLAMPCPWPPHPLGFGACLGRYLLAGSETDQVTQCGAYRGEPGRSPAAHDQRPPQPESQQPFRPLPSSPPLPSFLSLCVVWHYPYEHDRSGMPAHHSFAVFVARRSTFSRNSPVIFVRTRARSG